MKPFSDDLAVRILALLQEEALLRYPAFPLAFGLLSPVLMSELPVALSSDGLHLFYNPILLCKAFAEDTVDLRYIYLHIHLHCISLHPLLSPPQDDTVPITENQWQMSCDLAVAVLIKQLGDLPEKISNLKHSALLNELPADPCRIVRLLEQSDQTKALQLLASELYCDTHSLWQHTSVFQDQSTASVSPDQLASLQKAEEIFRKWNTSHLSLEKEIGSSKRQKGGGGGNKHEEAGLQQRNAIDYRHFLQRFTVAREEAILDMESFDYIPYYLGLTQYGNMPFLEPLEYSEVNRLDELAIAIDTSGSCSGPIVRRFLEETWSILKQKENFFSKMRIHLLQCDCVIQEHRIITSIEEWEESIPSLEIQGFGDTDFCPVFQLLDRLIAEKEIRNLRGLLYFTDGDGVFPSKAPAYDTAFVFLNHELEKHDIPSWAIRLNLNLPDVFT